MDKRLLAANKLHQDGKILEAEKQYHALLNEEIRSPHVLLLLAAIEISRGHNGLAINLLRQAVRYRPNFPEAFNNMGGAFRQEGRVKEARQCFHKALSIKDDDADVYNNLGATYINEGCSADGLQFLDKAIQLNPKNHQAAWNKALCLLELGQFEEGYELYDHGLLVGEFRHEREYEVPTWDGEKGKNVVVYGEQGLGDEIMFASKINKLIADCSSVHIDCHPRLETIFKRSFPNAVVHGTRKEEWIDWVRPGMLDAKVAIGSLPKFYPGGEDAVYLKAGRPMDLAHLKKPLIGISWEGGKKKTRRDLRSIYLRELKPLLDMDATFVSLQYTKNADEEVEAFERDTGIKLFHWPDTVREKDYDVTMSLVAAMDLVITVNTSLVHLCGAMGKECWVLTPSKPAWRYQLTGDGMPYYGNHIKQYRQQWDDWRPTIRRVGLDLEAWLPIRKAS